eukprot:6441528-Amphidinium_carterae.1
MLHASQRAYFYLSTRATLIGGQLDLLQVQLKNHGCCNLAAINSAIRLDAEDWLVDVRVAPAHVFFTICGCTNLQIMLRCTTRWHQRHNAHSMQLSTRSKQWESCAKSVQLTPMATSSMSAKPVPAHGVLSRINAVPVSPAYRVASSLFLRCVLHVRALESELES